MFERLSDRSWAVVARARREAIRRGDPLVHSGHLLLGVFGDYGPGGAEVLLRLGITARSVRRRPLKVAGNSGSRPGDLAGFSVRAEEVFTGALEYADLTRFSLVEGP